MPFTSQLSKMFICASLLIITTPLLPASVAIHMAALEEYFKDKDDLSIVLGAGERDGYEDGKYNKANDDYKIFGERRDKDNNIIAKSYTFILSYDIKVDRLLKSDTINAAIEELKQKLSGGQKEPLPIPLNFNESGFFDFLDKLHGQFKEIIFGASVTKFIDWRKSEVAKIFKALKDGGEFYFNIIPGALGVGMIQGTKFVSLSYRTMITNMHLDYPSNSYDDSLIPAVATIISTNKAIQAGANVDKAPDQPGFSVFHAPSMKYIQEHILNMLKTVGFKAEYKENAPYPLHAPWNWGGIDFQNYHYIYAQKPKFMNMYVDAVIKYFTQDLAAKDRNDLTMVLGAGDLIGKNKYKGENNSPYKDDSERFNGYTFMISMDIGETNLKQFLGITIEPITVDIIADTLKQILSNNPETPLPINFDFNSKEFFDFLSNFNSRFKTIIFELGEIFGHPFQFLPNISKVLMDGGDLYVADNLKKELYVKQSYLLNLGFTAEYVTKGEYPIPEHRCQSRKHDYSRFQKPMALEKKLVELKNSLAQLKTKLQALNTKLADLSGALGH